MAFLLRSRVSGSGSFIVFDVGSASVTGAVMGSETGKVPKVMHSYTMPIVLQKNPEPKRLISSMLDALEKCAESCSSALADMRVSGDVADAEPQACHIFFSSVWCYSSPRVIAMRSARPVTVSPRSIHNALHSEIESAESSMRSDGNLSLFKAGDDLVEKKIMQIRLNGYEVSDLGGSKAKSVELDVLMSFVPKRLRESVVSRIRKHVHCLAHEFHSFLLASFAAVRDLSNGRENFLLIDVAGEVTDIAVIRRGVIAECVSFPLGKNFILRKVSEAVGVSAEVAESYVRMLAEGKFDHKAMSSVRAAVETAGKDWLEVFNQSVSELSEEIFMPKKAFLTVDEAFESVFMGAVASASCDKLLVPNETMDPEIINSAAVKKYIEAKDAKPDPFIAIECLYISRHASAQS